MDKVYCPWCGKEMRFCVGGENLFMVCGKCFARSPSVTAERDEDGFLLEILPEKAAKAALISHAQNPLTLDEAQIEEAVWVEIKPDDELYSSLLMWIANESVAFIDGSENYRLSTSDYGVEWRCWATKPTDEERRAAKWDD